MSVTGSSNQIAKLRTKERESLANDGVIDKKEAEALRDIAQQSNTPDDWAALGDMFARDALKADVNVGALLGKNAPREDTRPSPIQKTPLGKGEDLYGKTVDAKVTRTLGSLEGYRTHHEALAMARLSGAPHTVVVQKGDRFFAAESNVGVDKPGKGVTAVAPLDMDAYRKIDSDTSLSADDKLRKRAAMAFGVPESQIHVIDKPEQSRAGVINIDKSIPSNKDGYTMKAGNVPGLVDGKTPAAVAVAPHVLKDPMRAATVLFHEGTHASDHSVANEIRKKLPADYNPDHAKHRAQAHAAVAKRTDLTRSQRDAVEEQLGIATRGAVANKEGGLQVPDHVQEARAHSRAIAAAIEHDPASVQMELAGFATDMKAALALEGTRFKDSKSFQELADALKKKLDTLPPEKREVFEAAAARLSKGHPDFIAALRERGVVRSPAPR